MVVETTHVTELLNTISLVHVRALTYVLSLTKRKDMCSFRAVNVALTVSFKLISFYRAMLCYRKLELH